MSSTEYLPAALCLLLLLAHVATTAIAMRRCRPAKHLLSPPAGAPAVTILRPVCGLDAYDHLTLRSTFELHYPSAQLIFCCDRPDDPAALLVRCLMAEYPSVNARLLIGRDPLTSNPKLNNLIKAGPQVRTDWLIMADSNLLMPADYVQRLLRAWGPRTGVLSAPPIGHLPGGFGGELECAFLNTYQARWQYSADSAGLGFAQGKTLVWRRRDLDAAGGLLALGAEVAEDAASTKAVRHLGLEAQLVDAPFQQPLGPRTLRQVWDRQARWARLRRMTFPAFFLPEILTTGLIPILAAAVLAGMLGQPALLGAGLAAGIWYGCEALLAHSSGWHLSLWSPLAWMARDLLLPALWVQAWAVDSFSWRGHQCSPEAASLSA